MAALLPRNQLGRKGLYYIYFKQESVFSPKNATGIALTKILIKQQKSPCIQASVA